MPTWRKPLPFFICGLTAVCSQLVEADLKFEAGEQLAAKTDTSNDIPAMNENMLSSIPAVHLTFDVIRCRVHIFSQLVEAWPECVNVLMNNQHPMVCVSSIMNFRVNINNVFVKNIS